MQAGEQTRHPHASSEQENRLHQRDKLAEENKVLLSNISILYKTAMAELDRKNATIKDLHAQCVLPHIPQLHHTLINP